MAEEERFLEEVKLEGVKKEIAQREAQERISKGIPGKGYKGNFLTFCKGCHTEYHHAAVEVCNRCGKETVSHDVSKPFDQHLIPSENSISGTFQKEFKVSLNI